MIKSKKTDNSTYLQTYILYFAEETEAERRKASCSLLGSLLTRWTLGGEVAGIRGGLVLMVYVVNVIQTLVDGAAPGYCQVHLGGILG